MSRTTRGFVCREHNFTALCFALGDPLLSTVCLTVNHGSRPLVVSVDLNSTPARPPPPSTTVFLFTSCLRLEMKYCLAATLTGSKREKKITVKYTVQYQNRCLKRGEWGDIRVIYFVFLLVCFFLSLFCKKNLPLLLCYFCSDK